MRKVPSISGYAVRQRKNYSTKDTILINYWKKISDKHKSKIERHAEFITIKQIN